MSAPLRTSSLPSSAEQSLRSVRICMEVPAAELLDKLTILEIKLCMLKDPSRLENVERELQKARRRALMYIQQDDKLEQLTSQLKAVNLALWQLEETLRLCEARLDFGARFIVLARGVYQKNDQRAQIKRSINEYLGSDLVEEKSY